MRAESSGKEKIKPLKGGDSKTRKQNPGERKGIEAKVWKIHLQEESKRLTSEKSRRKSRQRKVSERKKKSLVRAKTTYVEREFEGMHDE
ncbi:hypothetical protein DEO72_LG4g1912 [Vigna unguiculata]|uniref:Uncharacterized protein n=1 Tax=Vigna unguiculata TaxID=3917 RepID=A0A4D6LR20_VIGUN|nr:hypothetical protein DEO72_LG4g1912 [Vigna unguiculata]